MSKTRVNPTYFKSYQFIMYYFVNAEKIEKSDSIEIIYHLSKLPNYIKTEHPTCEHYSAKIGTDYGYIIEFIIRKDDYCQLMIKSY